MVSISLSVGERDALFTTMNASLRKRVAKTLTHKYAVLNDGTLSPNPVASDVDSICRTDSFVRYMGCASDEWNEHGPIQCVPPPLSVNYHPDCSTPYVYATAAEVFALGWCSGAGLITKKIKGSWWSHFNACLQRLCLLLAPLGRSLASISSSRLRPDPPPLWAPGHAVGIASRPLLLLCVLILRCRHSAYARVRTQGSKTQGTCTYL